MVGWEDEPIKLKKKKSRNSLLAELDKLNFEYSICLAGKFAQGILLGELSRAQIKVKLGYALLTLAL
jgi:hypothetical protein